MPAPTVRARWSLLASAAALLTLATLAGCGSGSSGDDEGALSMAASAQTTAAAPAGTVEAAPFDEDDLVQAGILVAADLPAGFVVDEGSGDGRDDGPMRFDDCEPEAYRGDAYRGDLSFRYLRPGFEGPTWANARIYLYLNPDLARRGLAAVDDRALMECRLAQTLRQANLPPDRVTSGYIDRDPVGSVERLPAREGPDGEIVGWRMTLSNLPLQTSEPLEPLVSDVWYARVGRALVTIELASYGGPPPEDEAHAIVDRVAARLAAQPQGESVPTPSTP